MLRQNHRRSGFTLIELLVVITIIVILTGLLMSGVQRARIAGKKTENGVRLNELSEAVSRCKGDLKLAYIPSQPMNTTVAPGTAVAPVGFALKAVYNGNEPELAILLRAFPNMNTAANPDPSTGDTSNGYTPISASGADVLDANQVLCFFLAGVGDTVSGSVFGSGFSNNSRKPFLPAAATETRKGPWVQNNQKYFAMAPNGRPWLVDLYGVPFAYFASVGGKANNYGIQTFNGASPYVGGNSRFINESGFQIISAGYDKVFGPGGSNIPATGNPGGEDDQSNFSKSLLGGGVN